MCEYCVKKCGQYMRGALADMVPYSIAGVPALLFVFALLFSFSPVFPIPCFLFSVAGRG